MNQDYQCEIRERAEKVLAKLPATQQRRALRYLLKNPGAYTHEISANCAIGYPPNRLGELNKEVLPKYGLRLNCHRPTEWLKNRWGEESHVHQWRLELAPIPGN